MFWCTEVKLGYSVIGSKRKFSLHFNLYMRESVKVLSCIWDTLWYLSELTRLPAPEMAIITLSLLLNFLFLHVHQHVAISSGPFAQTYSHCGLCLQQGRWPNRSWTASRFIFSPSRETAHSGQEHLAWKTSVRSWDAANCTTEFTSAHESSKVNQQLIRGW